MVNYYKAFHVNSHSHTDDGMVITQLLQYFMFLLQFILY